MTTGAHTYPVSVPSLPWGEKGHRIAARLAVEALPAEVPAFFRAAADQLVYLNPEPDRWRDATFVEANEAWRYDHYIDLERVDDEARNARDRFAFYRALYDAGFERPERDVGFLPFRIVETYQRIVTEWRLWSAASAEERPWIQARIIDDAGILGHFVTDGSQPHHTTIHFDGWDASTPNPEGYRELRGFHADFESRFVEEHIEIDDVRSRVERPTSVAGDPRAAVRSFLDETHSHVEELYRLERDVGFRSDRPATAETRSFTAERLASGATMLATLWWSAWLEGTGARQP